MESKILNSVLLVTAGIFGYRFVKAVVVYKDHRNEHDDILDDSDQD